MTQDTKKKPYRNADYLNFIRSKPCWICGRKPAQAAHVRKHYWGSGAGIKPSDLVTLPTCHNCHSYEHSGLTKISDLDKFREIINLLMEYIESKRPLARR